MAEEAMATAATEAQGFIMPPGWELLEWEKRGPHVHIRAEAPDGRLVKAHFEILPIVMEADPLAWLKQVIDLELLWAMDSASA